MNSPSELLSVDDKESDITDLEVDSEDDPIWAPSPFWTLDKADDPDTLFTVSTLVESLLGHSVYHSFPSHQLAVVRTATERLWIKSGHKKIVRVAQLETVVAVECEGKNVIHEAATGSGKTITMGILMLLHPDTIFITVSPLNELQRGQVLDLEEIGIKSLAVNGSTNKSFSFWKGVLEEGTYQNFIVQPEIFWEGGAQNHFRTLLRNTEFRKRIGFLLVDEAHNIDRWGRSHDGSPAFRPAWARLGEARSAFLGPHRVLSFTATAPGDIMHQLHVSKRIILGVWT